MFSVQQTIHEACVTRAKQETYGEKTRRVREEKEYGLREFAKMIGVSATYLSQVERDELPAPAEERVVKTAELLDLDKDELLALAGRVASDLEEIILEKPRGTADLLRHIKNMSAKQLEEFNKGLGKLKK
jgi:transcriptional regulator with XRE-family HTH domain